MAFVQVGERRFRIYAPSLAMWPAARWVLVQDDGPNVQFRSRGDVPPADGAAGEVPRSWSFDEAIAFVQEHPDDEVAQLLLKELSYFYFLEPMPDSSRSPESE